MTMAKNIDYYELRNDGNGDYSVLGFGSYPAHSVLAGAPKKVRVEGITARSPDEAMRIASDEYGDMNWYNSFVSASADSWINALRDDGELY